MRFRRILLAALLVTTSLAALVPAAHNHGHRLYVASRVLDDDGYPVLNESFQIQLDGLEIAGAEGGRATWGPNFCPRNPCQYQTNSLGGFEVFWHAHSTSESGSVQVSLQGKTVEEEYDTKRRWTNVPTIRLDESVNHSSATWERFNRTYIVRGMLWVPNGNPPDAETTWSDGSPPGCQQEQRGARGCAPVPVDVEIELPDGTVLNRTTQTQSGYGTFQVQLRADQPITGGSGTVSALDQSWDFQLDTTSHATSRTFDFPRQGGLDELPIVPLVVIAGLIGGGAVLYIGGQKWRDRRELEKAREKSSRKRANE